jgi:tetratricopeptide (TPR) repeat protein
MRVFSKIQMFVVLTALVSACATPQGALVNVVVPPKYNLKLLSEEIKTVNMKQLSGASECARPLKNRIDEEIAKTDVFKKEIGGFEESGATSIDVQGSVEKCSVSMGSGSLSATFTIIYNGATWRTFNISKDTNRPGAPVGEVLDVVVQRVAREFVSMFVPTTRQELRVFKDLDKDDAGMTAAMNSNWDLAIEIWSKKLRKTPSDHFMLYDRGVAYEARGDLKKAIADYQKALSIRKEEAYAQALARAQNALKALEEKERMKSE